MPSLETQPYTLNAEEGLRIHLAETPVLVKATYEQTGGAFNLFDLTCMPGFDTSLHIHYAEDVAIYVLEGTLCVFWGGEKKEAVVGSFFYQPRGTPHGFRVEGTAPARILYMNFPAGLDRFVVEQDRLAPNSEWVTAAARYKIEILGPLAE